MRFGLLLLVAVSCAACGRPQTNGAATDPVTALRAGCQANKAGDCLALGVRYQNGDGVSRDLSTALSYYERGCTGRDAESCHMAGQAYLIGAGATRDVEKAIQFLRTACDLEDRNGCYKLGDTYVGGAFGPPVDPPQGLGFLAKACALGHSSGCYRAGSTLEMGAAGVKKDLAQAREYYTKGCGANNDGSLPVTADSLGQAGSCSRLGMMIAASAKTERARSEGDLLQRVGREYFARGCDSGTPQDCYVLGGMYEGGEGAPRDRQKAHELFQRACSLGIGRACQAAERLTSTVDHRR